VKALVDDADEETRESLTDALGQAKGESRQLLDLLFQLCVDDGEIVKDNALDALETIASPKAIPRLLELEDPNIPKLVDVLLACSKDATDVAPVVARFEEWLDSTIHVDEGHQGARGLGARAKAMIPKLEELSTAKKDWHRMHAICSLHAVTGERKYLDLVFKGLGEKKADPRVIAGEYLKELGEPVLAELKELAEKGNAGQKKHAPVIIKIIERRMERTAG
jgi:HEAT repeat protein